MIFRSMIYCWIINCDQSRMGPSPSCSDSYRLRWIPWMSISLPLFLSCFLVQNSSRVLILRIDISFLVDWDAVWVVRIVFFTWVFGFGLIWVSLLISLEDNLPRVLYMFGCAKSLTAWRASPVWDLAVIQPWNSELCMVEYRSHYVDKQMRCQLVRCFLSRNIKKICNAKSAMVWLLHLYGTTPIYISMVRGWSPEKRLEIFVSLCSRIALKIYIGSDNDQFQFPISSEPICSCSAKLDLASRHRNLVGEISPQHQPAYS